MLKYEGRAVLDTNGAIISCNNRFASALGFRHPDEAVGKNITQVTPVSLRQVASRLLNAYKKREVSGDTTIGRVLLMVPAVVGRHKGERRLLGHELLHRATVKPEFKGGVLQRLVLSVVPAEMNRVIYNRSRQNALRHKALDYVREIFHLRSEIEFEQLLKEMGGRIREIIGADAAKVSIVREGKVVPMMVLDEHGVIASTSPLWRESRRYDGLGGKVAQAGRPLIFDVLNPSEHGFSSAMAVPLTYPLTKAPHGRDVSAVITLFSRAERGFGVDDARLAHDLFSQLEPVQASFRERFWNIFVDRFHREGKVVSVLNNDGWKELVERKMPSGARGVVLFGDLDRFKAVNDRLGMEVGDSVLKAFGEIVHRNLRGGFDRVARLGGDEFVVFLESPTIKPALRLVTKIKKEFEAWQKNNAGMLTPESWSRPLAMSASFGYARVKNSIEDARKDAEEMKKLAKEKYYKKAGVERRGHEARPPPRKKPRRS